MKLKCFNYLFLLLFFSFTTVCSYSQTVNKDFFDGEIYVKYNDDFAIDFSNQFVEPQSLVGLNEELVKEFGIIQARFSFNKISDIKLQRTVRLKFTEHEKADDLIKYFEQLAYIEYAEKIPLVYPTYTPNDFGKNNYNDVWHLYKIKATKAWDFTKGDTNITVAVVDQEVDINHPDLKDNIWTNPNEIPNNGYVDDVHGWDVADNDNTPNNYNNSILNHGTPCAGLISAITNNNIGISSIGFNLRIIPVKASSDNQTNNFITYAYDGIAYAAQIKADIISCSFGGSISSSTAQNTIKFASAQGSIIVASAGNNNNSAAHYPASYLNVISVAASEINDKKASFSTYGNSISVTAPGVRIRTTLKDGNYVSFNGTSASCPLTAGLLGLMKSYMPSIKNNDLEQCLINSADNIDNLNPSYIGKLGSGRVNAERALQCVDSIKKSPTTINANASKNYICPNEKVILTAESYKRPLDSAIWYVFRRGFTEILKGEQIEVSFKSDSAYSIAVVGYDKYGKDSIYLNQFIQVNALYKTNFYLETFENEKPNYSIISSGNNINWKKTNAPKTNNGSNSALKLDYYNSSFLWRGERSVFITQPIDLRRALKPLFTFQYAFGRNSSVNDSLNVYLSTDSGKTFPYTIFSKDLPTIYTRSYFSNFIPVTNHDWCILNSNKCPSISLDSFAGKKNIVLKFEAYYNGGNNLYIDDIRVFTNCGDAILTKAQSSFNSSKATICTNDSIMYNSTSTQYPDTHTWIFEGGTPDTAYGLNPRISYKQTGSFDVTLITSNVLGGDTLLLKEYVTVAVPPKIIVSDTQQYVCPKDSVFFIAWGADRIVWLNINTNKIIIDSVLGDKPVQNTFYQAKAITSEGCFDTVTVKAILVPLPPVVSTNQRLDSLEAVHNAGNFIYRWYFNDTLSINHTTKTIRPYQTGNYKVEIIDSAACSSISNNVFISTVGIKELLLNGILLYPNPAKKQLTISGLKAGIETTLSITDVLGKVVYTTHSQNPIMTVDVSAFAKGLYFIKIAQGEQSTTRKIIVE